MADLLGKQVGEYRLIQFLGNGTYGDVYEGVQIYLETHVAIKLLKGSFTEVEIKKFLDEARILAHLEHPHIVRILTFSVAMLDEQKLPFLAMSLAPNGKVLERHPRGTPLPLTTIVTYVKQIASALQYAHDHKYIHRDVKPENILLGKNDELLLSDFGIAVIAHSTNSLDRPNVSGTLSYMAPEQLEGRPRKASDQYALGIIAYEWLCGTRPFRGTQTEIISQHLSTLPPPFKKELCIPPPIEDVVRKALAKDWHQRFACVQEFAEALEQAANASPQIARPPRQPSQTPPSPQFHPQQSRAAALQSNLTPKEPEVHSPNQSDGDVASVPFLPYPQAKEKQPSKASEPPPPTSPLVLKPVSDVNEQLIQGKQVQQKPIAMPPVESIQQRESSSFPLPVQIRTRPDFSAVHLSTHTSVPESSASASTPKVQRRIQPLQATWDLLIEVLPVLVNLLVDLLLVVGIIIAIIWYLMIPFIGYIASAPGSGLGGGLKWGLRLLILISIPVVALQLTRRKIRHGRDLASFMLEVKEAQLWVEKINEQQSISIKEVSRIRQGDGSDVLGPNDLRKADIGILYVAPDHSRQEVLYAIHAQELLGRKQIAIVLPEERIRESQAFRRAVEFDGLKKMRRGLKAELVFIIAPGGSRPDPAAFARQRRFTVFTSLDSWARSLRS